MNLRNFPKKNFEPYTPVNKELFEFKASYLDEVFTTRKTTENVRKECDQVYSFRFLTEEYCLQVEEEISKFLEISANSGIALHVKNFGFEEVVKKMVKEHISSLLPSLYPDFKDMKFDVYPKLMTYKTGKNEDWPIHTDGDLATVLICLSKNFEGTDLRIYGNKDDDFVDYKHQIGRAVILPGNVRHAVTPLKSGTRYSLVIKLNQVGENY